MTDKDTADAVEALAYRVRERDAAIRAGEDVADAEPFAREFLLALRERGGWRPTAAKVIPWGTAKSGAGVKAPADLLAEAKAACEEATARQEAAVRQKAAIRDDDGSAA